MGTIDDFLPPDKADWAKCTQHIDQLLESIASTTHIQMRATLDKDAYDALRNQFKRPRRGVPREFSVYRPLGTVTFRCDESPSERLAEE